MFSFFQKKDYLVDHLHGLVDIHNHILPGIDDGAKTVGDSIDLIKGFSEFGVTNFICTPHIMHNMHDNTPYSIKKAYEQLSSALDENGMQDIRLTCAAEHMIDDNFEQILENQEVMPLGKDYLLIEMSYLQPSFNFDIAVEKIAKHQYFPILAHPERYIYFHGKYGKYESMTSKGINFQLNLLSLGNYYGAEIKKTALKLLDDGQIHFVGSDVHHTNHLKRLKETSVSPRTLQKLDPIINNTINSFY